MNYISVKHLSFAYENEKVLHDVSLEVSAGEFVVLTGENGAAKSTLLKIILGLLPLQEGEVKVANLRIGYAPQQIAAFNTGFPSTVYDVVASGLYASKKWFYSLTQADKERIEMALHSVNMWEERTRKIGELSGGQKQRIFLARLFARDPDIFILDEPTTGMDTTSRKNFYTLLKHSCHAHSKAVLLVTHENDVVGEYADKQFHLSRGGSDQWKCFSMTSCNEPL